MNKATINTAVTGARELTTAELDAVTGGASPSVTVGNSWVAPLLPSADPAYNEPAMRAWNNLLRQYGF
jgi:hypothetical protein